MLKPFLELCLTVRRDVVEDCENAGRRESHVTSLRLSYLAGIDSFSSRPAPKPAVRLDEVCDRSRAGNAISRQFLAWTRAALFFCSKLLREPDLQLAGDRANLRFCRSARLFKNRE